MIAEICASPEPGSVGLKPLLKILRTSLGTGGGLGKGKDGPEIVLQGDHRDAVVARLVGFGYKAKSAGG